MVVKRHALHVFRAHADRLDAVLYCCWTMLECVKDEDLLEALQGDMGAPGKEGSGSVSAA